MPVKRNDSRLPSCKTVVIEGKGMRIKGTKNGKLATTKCKVRNIVTRDGNVTTYSKTNEPKTKVKEMTKTHKLEIKHNNQSAVFTYDTGAQITTVNRNTARNIGILNLNGTSIYEERRMNITGVGGERSGKNYLNVPLTINDTNETAVGDIFVPDDFNPLTNLLGIPHIKKYVRCRVKYRPRLVLVLVTGTRDPAKQGREGGLRTFFWQRSC